MLAAKPAAAACRAAALPPLVLLCLLTILLHLILRSAPAWRTYRTSTHFSHPAAAAAAAAQGGCTDAALLSAAGSPCVRDLPRLLRGSLVYLSPSRYLYCAIPKNGCSYHLGLLFRTAGEPRWARVSEVHSPEKKAAYRLSARPHAAVAAVLRQALPAYAVVRNPLARTLSAYLDKVERGLGPELRTPETFGEWVLETFPRSGAAVAGVNPHWRPQSSFCGFGVRDFAARFEIFRVEQPQGFVDFVYRNVPREFLDHGWGFPRNVSFRESVLGPRTRTVNTGERFATYFANLTVFDHLAASLKADIKMLNYTDEVREMRRQVVAGLKRAGADGGGSGT